MRLANQALDECRRRTQNDTLGHRGRKGDPLYGARKLLLTGDADQAAARLDEAIEYCRAPEAAPELHKLARTLHRWKTEIETCARTRTHNGRTEAANAKIKDVKRSARGLRSFANYRLRILLATGQNPATLNPPQKSEPDVPAQTRRARKQPANVDCGS